VVATATPHPNCRLGDVLKSSSLIPGRFALTGVALAALCLTVPSALALGLGRLSVQSALGESLRAEIDVTSITPEESGNLKLRIASPDAYRAAGVDYNPVLPGTQAVLMRRADGRPYLRLTSDRVVQEPFVDVILEATWNTGRLVREYTLLFDPPTTTARAPAPAPAPTTAPVIAAAPSNEVSPAAAQAAAARLAERKAAPAKAPAPEPAERPPAEPRKAAEPVTTATAPTPAAGGDEYRVKPGDTLSGIAGRSVRPGISLDQMLVSLYRGNPQAFVDNNMNRLKAGVVLAVPAPDAAKAVPQAEARQVIEAQSADFGAYRQRLAGAVPAAQPEGSGRQASGKVQAAVEDRKQGSAPAPDKLTLSKGGAGPKASAPEEAISKASETKNDATRAAELKKNVEDLKKLTAATAATAAAASRPATTVAAAPPTAPPVAAPPAPAPIAPPAVVAPPPPVAPPVAPPPVVAAAPAPAPAVVPPPPAPAPAPAAPVPAPTPAAAPAAPRVTAMPSGVAAEEPGVIGSLLEDNPLAVGGGGLVIALLAGFGVYRFVKRAKRDSGETSFLESRLQPDSFFGVSGGQRIDTREAATGTPSSMSYSLSQLDAIGDVDPVAEADVYLAYGRDLQAEEILKEAMRGNPERMAIRTKLLEVYAKRRDTKGFELLAMQLYGLTRGEGEDWAKAQELGAQIDPENPLYQPGGQPKLPEGLEGRAIEPLGASTMPQSVLPSPSQFGELAIASAAAAAAPAAGLDLDLDLDLPVTAPPPPTPEVTRPMPAFASISDEMDFELPSAAALATEPSSASRDLSLDFDLSGISLDLDAPATAQPDLAAPVSDLDMFELPDVADDGADPFERKLELAEEFRQIGDMEGARDLLQDVIARSDGALKTKAQAMLDSLS